VQGAFMLKSSVIKGLQGPCRTIAVQALASVNVAPVVSRGYQTVAPFQEHISTTGSSWRTATDASLVLYRSFAAKAEVRWRASQDKSQMQSSEWRRILRNFRGLPKGSYFCEYRRQWDPSA